MSTRRSAADAGLLGAMASVATGAVFTLIASGAAPESGKTPVTVEQPVCESRPTGAASLDGEERTGFRSPPTN